MSQGSRYSPWWCVSRAPRGYRLQRLFSTFPEGWPGIGLIFLRLVIALRVIVRGVGVVVESNGNGLSVWVAGSLTIVVGVALLAGFVTPVASALTTIGYLVAGFSPFLMSGGNNPIGALQGLDLAAVACALMFLGPGAFSVDALLFGRREIIIPDDRRRPHDRGRE